MSAYVPPHRRGKAAVVPQQQQPQQQHDEPPSRFFPPKSSRDNNAEQPSRFFPPPTPPHSSTTSRGSGQDVRSSGRDRYVSAYRQEEPVSEGSSTAEQYAELVKFSRYRREHLGQRRVASSNPKRHSSPSAFGAFDHGRGMEPDEDLEGGRRVDDEGMVYEVGQGQCVYYCDRFRRYKFFCGPEGLALLKAFVAVNVKLLEANAELFATKSADEAAAERAEGYALYEEKPNLRRKTKEIGTWSDREYGLPGFQWMYLRLKSYQRFSETWALLERCGNAGLFDKGGPLSFEDEPLTVVSLGGGPGYELLAFDWFARYWQQSQDRSFLADSKFLDDKNFKVPKLSFASFDLQASWQRYVDILGYGFQQWDVHGPEALQSVLNLVPKDDGARVVCMLSNILCYCSDDQTADLFYDLLTSRVTAIVVNERGAVQGIVGMLQRRNIRVLRLLDQITAGRDDRQLVFLPPLSDADQNTTLPDTIPLPDDFFTVLPNQPYEEKKKKLSSQQPQPH